MMEECREEFYFAEKEIHLGLPKNGSALDDRCWNIAPMTSDVVCKTASLLLIRQTVCSMQLYTLLFYTVRY